VGEKAEIESMSVRAKFKLDTITIGQSQRLIDQSKSWTSDNTETVEMRTLQFSPVYANGDPEHENSKFWRATPSGKLELGTINPEAWQNFEIGKEYYVDFTPAANGAV
jgi:hypothetical protein